jgi:hypothetical protein
MSTQPAAPVHLPDTAAPLWAGEGPRPPFPWQAKGAPIQIIDRAEFW